MDILTNDVYAARRKQLVKTLKDIGISSNAVLKAIESVPRHLFMDKSLIALAYENKALHIDCGQTISQPYTVALETETLDLKKTDTVLEIGTGSGYQCAVLSLLANNVYSIERQELLHLKAKSLLSNLGYKNIQCIFGDGYNGLPERSPFDKIIVTAGAEELPKNLLKQLKIGGILVIPIKEQESMKICKITRITDKDFQREYIDDCAFVPMLKGVVNK